jgi:hypothetical protein
MSCLFFAIGQCAFALLDSDRMFNESYDHWFWLRDGDGVRSRLLLSRDADPFIEIYWATTGESLGIEFPVSIVPGVVYRLGLRLSADEAVTWLRDPVLWVSPDEAALPWTSVAPLGDDLMVLYDDRPQRILLDRENSPVPQLLDAPHTELRVWLDSEGAQWYAVILPGLNQIRMHVRNIAFLLVPRWSELTSGSQRVVDLGEQGSAPNESIQPISFDIAADGRIFLLDAGNERIKVLSLDGTYITHWGSRGDGPGQFNFGGGLNPEDFDGSVVVDEEGFIYVADEQRIQKFAP